MYKALRGLVAGLLSDVAAEGLPGDHHFFITFATRHPGVDLPEWMVEKYPDEMTIVLQHAYENLAVAEDRFSVQLRFSDVPYTLVIPLDAIRTFVDPSVEFGLRFDGAEPDAEDIVEALNEVMDDDADTPNKDDGASKEGGVISLDAFRKT